MPAISGRAPGKLILFGEHSVVYGRPAIAVPVTQVQAKVTIFADPLAPAGRVLIDAPDVGLQCELAALPESDPSRLLVAALLQELSISRLPALKVRINSTIPVAAGLGSGAAVSVAALRALSSFLGHPLNDERVNALAFQVEKAYHGTPSGIDNTVITYCQPLFFVRGLPFELLRVAQAFTLVIADSGISSPTSAAVGGLRERWQTNPAPYEAIFDQAGALARKARQVIESGSPRDLGPLMDHNQELLIRMGVSCPELNRLVAAARSAGAWGAKLSGAGLGGNMIALTAPDAAPEIARALEAVGAVRTIITTVEKTG
jgi:mevalonate kinase